MASADGQIEIGRDGNLPRLLQLACESTIFLRPWGKVILPSLICS